MNALEFWSNDRRLGLRLEPALIYRLQLLCVESGDLETGGILIGYYSSNQDCAVPTEITGAPADAQCGRTWFQRGIFGLKELLHLRWHERRESYLGDWHFHPGGSCRPSGLDIASMRALARDKRARCPFPVLLVVGGQEGVFSVSATAVPASGPIEMGFGALPEPKGTTTNEQPPQGEPKRGRL